VLVSASRIASSSTAVTLVWSRDIAGAPGNVHEYDTFDTVLGTIRFITAG
jgi:hypothetical protein